MFHLILIDGVSGTDGLYEKAKTLQNLLVVKKIPFAKWEILANDDWDAPNVNLSSIATKTWLITREFKGFDDFTVKAFYEKYFLEEDFPTVNIIRVTDEMPIILKDIVETNNPVMTWAWRSAAGKLYRTLLAKNRDYSSANMLLTGNIGAVTRLWDKMARLLSLSGFTYKLESIGTFTAPKEARNEPMDDTYLDLANYAIIAWLLFKGLWGR